MGQKKLKESVQDKLKEVFEGFEHKTLSELANYINYKLPPDDFDALDGLYSFDKAEILLKLWVEEDTWEYSVEQDIITLHPDFTELEDTEPAKGFFNGKHSSEVKKDTALRYNKGKLRYDLLPHGPIEKLVEVYTRGAHKYSVYQDENGQQIKGSDIPFEEMQDKSLVVVSDGGDNWRKGLDWTGCMASVERHIAAWKKGEDFDPDPAMGTYHLANAAWGLLALIEYYSIYPQGDNRQHKYLDTPKIGLDIDEVLCDWVGGWTELYGMERPTSWYFDRELMDRFEEMKHENKLDDFYLSLRPLIKPEDIPFEPHCYITTRPVDTKVTEQWLADHGFPARPVFTTTDKATVAKEQGLDMFVDDSWANFVALNKAGITCYLMDREHNRRYDVGYRRVKSLKELF